jgi:Cysteine-rich CWC
MSDPLPLRESHCPLCGAPNRCVVAQCGSFEHPCWCESVSFGAGLLGQVPAPQRGRSCICADCAARAVPLAAPRRPHADAG